MQHKRLSSQISNVYVVIAHFFVHKKEKHALYLRVCVAYLRIRPLVLVGSFRVKVCGYCLVRQNQYLFSGPQIDRARYEFGLYSYYKRATKMLRESEQTHTHTHTHLTFTHDNKMQQIQSLT